MENKSEFYHMQTGRSGSNGVSPQLPEKELDSMATSFVAADANRVSPFDGRTALYQFSLERPEPSKARDSYTYYPSTVEIPEVVAPNIRNRSYGILATCTITDPRTAQGVLMTQGGFAGGHTLFLKEGKLNYVYNFLGMEEQAVVSKDIVPEGYVLLGVRFNREKEKPKGCAIGTATLYFNFKAVGSTTIRTQSGKFAVVGKGLVIGHMGADLVTKQCKAPFPFVGGSLKRVTIDVWGAHYQADLH